MAMTVAEAERSIRSGVAALQGGNPRGARAEFDKVVAAGLANAQVWLLLAHACRAAGDASAEEAAVDKLLEAEPRNLLGLIMKGDSRARAGDVRGATRFYRVALPVGRSAQLPADLAAELERVERFCADADRDYRAHLETALAEAGLGGDAAGARFRRSIDIMLGDKQVYQQQPSLYYFPELPQRQYYDPAEFDWAAEVEAATPMIREELSAALADERGFRPYMVSTPDAPRQDYHGLADNPDWSTLYLWENGGPNEENVARCPRTFELIDRLPLCRITTRAPSILFSLLRPGARIPPHNGVINTRLICHLPLIVPPNCGFRVGNEVRQWEEGKLLIFDDTIEHEAWNDSGENRVILIFDVWRPELAGEERRAVSAMFEAVDRF